MRPRLARLGIRGWTPTLLIQAFYLGRKPSTQCCVLLGTPYLHPSGCLFCPHRSCTLRSACMLWVRYLDQGSHVLCLLLLFSNPSTVLSSIGWGKGGTGILGLFSHQELWVWKFESPRPGYLGSGGCVARSETLLRCIAERSFLRHLSQDLCSCGGWILGRVMGGLSYCVASPNSFF